MTISSPISLPTSVSFRSLTIFAKGVRGRNRNTFSLKEQIYEYDGAMWGLSVQYPPLKIAEAKEIMAFLLACNFGSRTFLAGDPNAATPKGTATGTPLVMGASQTGYSLITDGWTAGVTNILRAGDFFRIGNNLFMNLTDVNSNGSGQATLDIFPNIGTTIRPSPSDNAPITTASPKGLFRLDTDTVTWTTNEEKLYDISFTATEAV